MEDGITYQFLQMAAVIAVGGTIGAFVWYKIKPPRRQEPRFYNVARLSVNRNFPQRRNANALWGIVAIVAIALVIILGVCTAVAN